MKWGDFTSDVSGDESSYDLIVGSDIIYSQLILDVLAQTISHYLKEDGTAYIANNTVRYDYYGH